MGYDPRFYERYESYLTEPRVRRAHDRALRVFSTFAGVPRVVDFGCGRSQEFRRFGDWESYVGFDAEADEEDPEDPCDPRRGDYRDPAFLQRLENMYFTAFVSLFSTEITASAIHNTRLYQNLFSRVEGLQYGIVSGFYYASSKDVNPIEETGGIVSWQTVHALEDQQVPEYEETRFQMRVPSDMFGEDVVEIWRMFVRRTPFARRR